MGSWQLTPLATVSLIKVMFAYLQMLDVYKVCKHLFCDVGYAVSLQKSEKTKTKTRERFVSKFNLASDLQANSYLIATET